jgi:hypothetical protein
MRLLIRLIILGLAGYGAKALYDRYGSTAQSVAAGKDQFTGPVKQAPETPRTANAEHRTSDASSHAPGRVDPNSPAAQADDAVAVAMATPPKLS